MLSTNLLDRSLRIKNAFVRFALSLDPRGKKSISILLVTSNNPISASQIFPFYYFQSELRQQCNIVFTEINIDKLLSGKPLPAKHVDLVFFQPWFDISETNLTEMLDTARSSYPLAKFAFLDSYAPVDLRLAKRLDSYVDVYIKKHVFRDRTSYGKETNGDTNLSDYYGKLYALSLTPTTFKVSAEFLDKLLVGPSFLTSNVMLPAFANAFKSNKVVRHIDVHARLGGQGDGWYGRMRTHAIQAISSIPSVNVVTETGKSHSEYLRELHSSKLCFSPFGFGEVCWRDYEAVMCGALLIKPEMGHVETNPNIFVPYETYVPVKWDFSDLEEKVVRYLRDDQERSRITENAYRLLSEYVVSNGFVDHVKAVLAKAFPQSSEGIAVTNKPNGIRK